MELWIRSQDKERLIKLNDIIVNANYCIVDGEIYGYRMFANGELFLGTYETKERCIEILDEIQNKIHQTFICELKPLLSRADCKRMKEALEVEYQNNEFIMQPPDYESKPINSNVVIYEMPKE